MANDSGGTGCLLLACGMIIIAMYSFGAFSDNEFTTHHLICDKEKQEAQIITSKFKANYDRQEVYTRAEMWDNAGKSISPKGTEFMAASRKCIVWDGGNWQCEDATGSRMRRENRDFFGETAYPNHPRLGKLYFYGVRFFGSRAYSFCPKS